MKSLGLFSQIIAIILAVVVGFFYVQPTVTEIGEIQTDTARYQVERKKIQEINQQLAQNIATFESVSRADKEQLAVYMPRQADDISIMRDISFIVDRAGVVSTALSYNGASTQEAFLFSEDDTNGSDLGDQAATPHAFTVGITGTYPAIKDFLRLLEQNHYPLEVHQLTMSATETGLMDANLSLITYVDELSLVTSN